MNNLFYVDVIEGVSFRYDELFTDLSSTRSYNKYCKSDSYYSIFKHILISLIIGEEIVLLDSDFSTDEIYKLLGNNSSLMEEQEIKLIDEITFEEIQNKIKSNKDSWKITLFTSGTTGLPKKISHTFDSLTRFIKIDASRKENVWGFAYNPYHMAGLQVFFQAFLNYNTIVRLFGLERISLINLINEYRVTNISSTPTFYRMLLPSNHICSNVMSLTSGGEKFDSKTLENLKEMFPNSQIRNIYASTEAGALFSSKGDEFIIRQEISHLIKFIKNELFIHHSLIGESEGLMLFDGWYQTGDIIAVINNNPFKFKFISRKNEMINTGGYKVNPTEVEEVIRKITGVIDAFVFGKKNSLLGNVVVCEVIVSDKLLSEKKIRLYLQDRLQEFKVPRIIKFVESINTTRTGKISRKK